MRIFGLGIALSAIGCAGTLNGDTADTRSWSHRENDAQHHEELADVHMRTVGEQAPPGKYTCGDTVLQDQSTSGGQPLMAWQPCFDAAEEVRVTELAAARRERALAGHDRQTAAALARAETLACDQVPASERTHSPLAHVKAIANVIPHRVGGALAGVRIELKRVPGLNAAWMQRAIDCRRAQWEVFGRDPQLDPDDPTLLDSADVAVSEHGGRVEVLITSDVPADAELALIRANREAALARR